MRAVLSIAKYTIKEHVRSRIYMVVLIFGLILLLAGIIFSSLAMEQRQRVLVNLGFASVEFLALLIMLLSASHLILEEMESRTLYLILSRPVHRLHYIGGRFLGMVASVALAVLIMGSMNLLFLMLFGVPWHTQYIFSLFFSLLKVILAGSMGLFFSIVSSSPVTAISFTGVVWILGHFSTELEYLIQKAGNLISKNIMLLFYYLTPHLNLFNYRDMWALPSPPDINWFFWLMGYTLIYVSGCLVLSYLLFLWKEF